VSHQSWTTTRLRFKLTVPGRRPLYDLVAGTVVLSVSLSETFANDPCPPSTYSATATISVFKDAFDDLEKIELLHVSSGGGLTLFPARGGVAYSGRGKFFKTLTANGTLVGLCAKEQLCNGGAPLQCVSSADQKKIEAVESWFYTFGEGHLVARDGSLSGTDEQSEGEAPYTQRYHWTWDLTPSGGTPHGKSSG
jgi:hypothetical protein